jgi:hypothetical protein
MKKLLNKKHEDGENGIAIVFSLIMLMVFFLISFGFVSMATNAKLAASIRLPAAQAALSNSETILNEALYAIDAKLMNDGVLDQALLNDLDFFNGTDTVTLKMWATKSTDVTDITNAFPLQVAATDFTPTTSANFGWIAISDLNGDGFSDRYAWMIIPSDGVDANYIGKTGTRKGDYSREMNVTELAANFQTEVFIDWASDDGGGEYVSNFWDSKKDLITSLTANIDIAIENLEVNTTPVQICNLDGNLLYDLSLDPSSDDLATFMGKISWLNDSTDNLQQEVAANIKDFIDADNIASAYTDTSGKSAVGNERVPYLNELIIKVENLTELGSSGDAKDTSLTITLTPEFYNMYVVTAWDEDGSGPVNGSQATIEVEMEITSKRGDAAAETVSHSQSVTYDLSSSTSTGYLTPSAATTDSKSITFGTPLEKTNVLTDFEINVTSITLLGSTDSANVWDKMSYEQDSGPTSIGASAEAETSIEASNPRDNIGNTTFPWAFQAWNVVGTYTAGAQNSNYTSTFREGETGEPKTWSTAYMPAAGKISELVELGSCYRSDGYTLNFTDYNAKIPERLVPATEPTTTLDLSDPDTFDGGDRSLVDYVMISSPGNKVTASTTIPAYEQFGAINPNTSNGDVIDLLLDNIKPSYGPKSTTVLSANMIEDFRDNFPGIENQSEGFKFDQFHQTDADNHHNRNPSTYGYAFSTKHTTPTTETITDVLREAAVFRSMKLVSPKYSYFTVLCAVDLLDTGGTSLGTVSKIRAFVRFDNESNTFKILQKTEI